MDDSEELSPLFPDPVRELFDAPLVVSSGDELDELEGFWSDLGSRSPERATAPLRAPKKVKKEKEKEKDKKEKKEKKSGKRSSGALAGECVVCLDANASHLIVPCGHQCLCQGCSGVVRTCPVCRGPKQQAVKVFLSGNQSLEQDDRDERKKKKKERKDKAKKRRGEDEDDLSDDLDFWDKLCEVPDDLERMPTQGSAAPLTPGSLAEREPTPPVLRPEVRRQPGASRQHRLADLIANNAMALFSPASNEVARQRSHSPQHRSRPPGAPVLRAGSYEAALEAFWQARHCPQHRNHEPSRPLLRAASNEAAAPPAAVVERLRDVLLQNRATQDSLLAALTELSDLGNLPYDLIKSTKIGKAVGALARRTNLEDPVRDAATTLRDTWWAAIQAKTRGQRARAGAHGEEVEI